MFKLPDGTEVDCTLVQARRVWEICNLRRNDTLEMCGDGVLIQDSRNEVIMHLVMPDGRVFNYNPGFYEPPPSMESEKPPEVSEFHRGVITAIETIWKHKFTSAAWTWEVQDILARAAADGKVNGLATLLETISTTDAVEHVLDAVYRLRPPQPKSPTEFTLNYCRGKLDAIKVAWAGRFSRALLDEHLDILVDAMQKDLTSADRFLTCLAGGGGFEVLRQELDRLKLGKKA